MTTKAEKQWLDAICRMGCVVCYMRGYPGTPAVPHHLLDEGGRRIGHLSTIPLCDPGHHQNAPAFGAILTAIGRTWICRRPECR